MKVIQNHHYYGNVIVNNNYTIQQEENEKKKFSFKSLKDFLEPIVWLLTNFGHIIPAIISFLKLL